MSEATDKKIILVVDDAFTNRILLKRIFSSEYQVEEAENGLLALAALKRLKENLRIVILDLSMPELDGYGVLDAMRRDETLRHIPVIIVTASDDSESQIRALNLGAEDVLAKPFNPEIVLHRVRNIVNRMEAIRQAEQARQRGEITRISETNAKSGIYNKQAFCEITARLIAANPQREYAILHWDFDRFKVFNDSFGTQAGDALLSSIGKAYKEHAPGMDGVLSYGHWDADHFVCCYAAEDFDLEQTAAKISRTVQSFSPNFKLDARFGAYRVDSSVSDVALMCDRALLALKSIKNNYESNCAWFEDGMRRNLLEEQELIGEMNQALADGQFVPYIQPQYDYSNGKISGAETLVRWIHPQKGIVSPGKFIPLFEQNGFISQLDEYIWRQACMLLRRWLDKEIKVVPLSVNVSRRDIYNPNLCRILLGLIEEYHLDASLLHLEITESAYVENPDQLIHTVDELRSHGFHVEMDDFGSGYSSLNTLKNVPVDTLKLDMKFTEIGQSDTRGGSILSSVVRMAHWIQLSVIAEGVETAQQADFLKSIGCIRMQGYFLHAPCRPRPMNCCFRAVRPPCPLRRRKTPARASTF